MSKEIKEKIIEILEKINDFIIDIKKDEVKLKQLKKPLKEYIADQILELFKEEINQQKINERKDNSNRRRIHL